MQLWLGGPLGLALMAFAEFYRVLPSFTEFLGFVAAPLQPGVNGVPRPREYGVCLDFAAWLARIGTGS